VYGSHSFARRHTRTTPPSVAEIGIGVDAETLEAIKNVVDYSSSWGTIDDLNRKYESTVFSVNDRFVTAYPVPIPPPVFNKVTTYYPDFFVIMSVEQAEVLDKVDVMDDRIDDDQVRKRFG